MWKGKIVKKFLAAIDTLTDASGCITLAILLVAIIIQVISRYVFNSPLSWPEEVASFAFLISTYMGISICMKNHAHLRITILPEYCSRLWHPLDILSMIANVVFFAVCLWLGYGLVVDAYESQMRCIGLPLDMWIILAFIPLSCLFICLQAMRNLCLLLAGKHFQHSHDVENEELGDA